MRNHVAFGLLLMALTACGQSNGATSTSADGSSVVTTVAAQESGKQYRAVCSEAAMHGGTPYVLSRWLDVKEKAVALGEYHSNFKEKGHRVIYEERVRPAQTTP
jgi:hypothetical protein